MRCCVFALVESCKPLPFLIGVVSILSNSSFFTIASLNFLGKLFVGLRPTAHRIIIAYRSPARWSFCQFDVKGNHRLKHQLAVLASNLSFNDLAERGAPVEHGAHNATYR